MVVFKMIKNPIILVDGSFYIHQAYYAFPPLTTSSGKPIWVVYGVINMIKSLLIRYQPIHMTIVFDAIGKTFRDDLFEKYKANRIQMPENLSNQIGALYEIIASMGIPILQVPYVEADDVIATLAVFHAQTGRNVLIATGDKDMAQIVSSQIILINTISNRILNSFDIEKKIGVPPRLIADYLALTGDRVDNIPGVPGIGKKTAQILLTKIGDLRTLYQNLDDIFTLGIRSDKMIRNALISNKKIALLSYQLASIKTNVLLKESDYILFKPMINIEELIKLFKKYEFNSWLIELKSGIWLKKYKCFRTTSAIEKKSDLNVDHIKNTFSSTLEFEKFIVSNSCNIKVINDIDKFQKWVESIQVTDSLILNICSDTNDIIKTKIISMCLSVCNSCIKNMIYVSFETNQLNNSCIQFKDILFILKPILENSKIKKIGQDMKFHYALLLRYGIHLSGIAFDVLLELYILYGSVNCKYIRHFLHKSTFDAILDFKESCDYYYCNCRLVSIQIKNIELKLLCSSRLIFSIFSLHQILWSEIKKNDNLKSIFEDIEIPLITILAEIERYGVLIDKELLNAHSITLNSRLDNLKTQVFQLVNIDFNLDSTKQLQAILYDQQGLPILKKTPNGFPSTSEEVLKKLSKKYLIPRIILEYRSLSKLKSTYINKLTSMINKNSNRVHTSYNQVRTSTGRLSSANPNLQNIPNRNQDGRKIRQAFIAPENFVIVSADYSQIELRIMAHLSHDSKLINDFLSGKDIHAITASEIFVTSLNLVTNEQRHQAKTINFGLIYGMSAFGLARQLSVTCKEAQQYVNRYFQRYPGIMKYMIYIKDNANKYGYVSTLNGRKLYLPDIYSTNISQKRSAERAAINAPMQGSAADIIKKAMISIDFWLKKDNIPARMIMQVHDELVFEVQNNFVDIAVKKIKKLMEECFILDVPLKVGIGIGKNWEQAH